ncbi:hypothetical protein SAMN02910369_02420 [Lachnospiraceae bacterium NE2001]|nr:hypothetical protein SAMN02910369_02420 [Lachnospiraceae bacterium NE2001]
MLRYEDISEISDGRLYGAEDKALLGTNGCKGCSHCCESDMGHSIVLTPYDMYQLKKGTGKSFDELLVSFVLELSMIDEVILPHLKMDTGCKFLKDGRCTIHEFRPGICRLFPLGRLYEGDAFKYFLQINECVKTSRTPVKISDWLGIEDLDKNTANISKWHKFLKYETKRVTEIKEMAGFEIKRIEGLEEKDLLGHAIATGEAEIYEEKGADDYRRDKLEELAEEAELRVKEIMKTVLRIFYMEGYNTEADFYEQFDARMKQCLAELRHI